MQGDSSGTFGGGNFATSSTQYSYNNVNELTATAAGGPIAFKATYTNPVKTAVANVTQTATVSGSIHGGDVVWLMVHDKGLSKAEPVTYTVVGTDTTTTIATALKNAVNADTKLSSLGVTATSSGAVVTISSASINATAYTASVIPSGHEAVSIGASQAATANISPSNAIAVSPTLAGGSSNTANTTSVTATSGGGTKATNNYAISINGATGTTLSYDSNGNMSSDGTNSYAYDAENRLIKITYPGTGKNSQFSYDPLGRCVKILEVTGGTSATTQLVWSLPDRPLEARDGTGAVTAQFFRLGEVISGTSYFYTRDHLGSVRELTDTSGAIKAQYQYDPYGNVSTIGTPSISSDFQYAGFYVHSRSGLDIAKFRFYSSSLGRWINRDPSGEGSGTNLYEYVGNNVVANTDPSGLFVVEYIPTITGTISGGDLGLPLPIGPNPSGLAHPGSWSYPVPREQLDPPFECCTSKECCDANKGRCDRACDAWYGEGGVHESASSYGACLRCCQSHSQNCPRKNPPYPGNVWRNCLSQPVPNHPELPPWGPDELPPLIQV